MLNGNYSVTKFRQQTMAHKSPVLRVSVIDPVHQVFARASTTTTTSQFSSIPRPSSSFPSLLFKVKKVPIATGMSNTEATEVKLQLGNYFLNSSIRFGGVASLNWPLL